MLTRRGEPGGTFFRCSRYFAVGHEWFAATRENGSLGPFPDRNQAELELAWQLASFEPAGETQPGGDTQQRSPTPLEVMMEEFRACRREAKDRGMLAACAWARQRLDDIESLPQRSAHAPLRENAIRHFLGESPL